MLLLLSGASDIARIALAEKIARGGETWRHFPLDRVSEMLPLDVLGIDPAVADDEVLFLLACDAIRQMLEEDFSMVVSHPDLSESLDLLRQEIDGDLVAIHLGDDEAEGFDLSIDLSKRSVNQALKELERFVQH
jgi:hypothetical protein